MSKQNTLTIILALFLVVMVCPAINIFDKAIGLCELVDQDMEESTSKCEAEDDIDELYTHDDLNKVICFGNNPATISKTCFEHVPPLLSIVSPPPERV